MIEYPNIILTVWEGQFKNGKVDGFNRHIRTSIRHSADFKYYIGWWRQEYFEGYGYKLEHYHQHIMGGRRRDVKKE
jgi:hypothetical protein